MQDSLIYGLASKNSRSDGLFLELMEPIMEPIP